MTIWPILYSPDDVWNGPKKVVECNSALPSHGGTNVILEATGGSTQTTARYAWAKVCVDFYYNSEHSGGQHCHESPQITIS
jgi:hypothetical protein